MTQVTIWRVKRSLIKCVWYASDIDCLLANLKSVMRGMGYHGYPPQWWRGSLRSFYLKVGLRRLVRFKTLRKWVMHEGPVAQPPTKEMLLNNNGWVGGSL